MDKYLLQILHDINTIIIPGLGALTVTNKATGEIMFMSFLKHDDGNLSKYISEKEGVSENDSKNLIAKYVREIQAKLDKGESYDMYQFGRFIKKNGEIDFENWNSYQTTESTNEQKPEPQHVVEAPIVELIPEQQTEEVPAVETPAEQIVIVEEVEAIEEIPVSEDQSIPEETSAAPEIAQAPVEATIDLSEIKPDENVYIPEEEVKELERKQAESKEQATPPPSTSTQASSTAKPKPAPANNKNKPDTKPKTKKEPKEKKKKSPAFWLMVVLGILIVLGGTGTAVFYKEVKAFISSDNKDSDAIELAKLDSIAKSDEELQQMEEQVELDSNGAEIPSGEDLNETVPEQAAVIEEPIKEVKQTQTQTQTSGPDASLPFHIIGGSFTSPENAERLAKKFQSEGKNARVLGKFDAFHMVSYESFATQQEANAALRSSSLAGKGWIFKYPK